MIIVEACTNWKDLNEAKQIIKVAHSCGDVLVKFQLFDAEEDKDKPHYEWVKAHELTFDQAKELFDYGQSIGQEVFFSVFDVKFVEWCERIGVKRYKIACDYRNRETLAAIIYTLKDIIVSTREAYPRGLLGIWLSQVKWLYCPEGYPSKSSMLDFEETNCDGYSDHSIGLDTLKIALARSAEIVEKHFVLEHDSRFPDDAWSMDTKDLKELIRWEKICREVL